MKDGTAEFKTVDARVAAIFDLIYPIGSVFATTGSAPTLGTWEEVAQGRTLQGADDNHAAGSTVEAGLPNITGNFVLEEYNPNNTINGAFSVWTPETISRTSAEGTNSTWGRMYFNASRSNPIYGNSSTVQPPAYIVRFYRRIA